MARKVARCLRKNYKKKVKATAKNEKAVASSATEIAALFDGAGDLNAAKRTVALAKSQLSGKVDGKHHISAKKAVAHTGKKHLVDKKKSIKHKTLFNDEDDDEANEEEEEQEINEEEEADDGNGGHQQLPPIDSLNTAEQLTKYRTLLRKQQVREKMALREHVRELEKRKGALRGGKHVADDMRKEKRDLGKYIKQLEDEQKHKHSDGMKDIDIRMAQIEAANRDPFSIAAERSRNRMRTYMLGSAAQQGIYQSGLAAGFSRPNFGTKNNQTNSNGDEVAADELKNMFAHLM